MARSEKGKGGSRQHAQWTSGLSAFKGGVHREVAVCVRTEDDSLSEQYHLGLGLFGRPCLQASKSLTFPLLAPYVARPHLPAGQPGISVAASISGTSLCL